MVARFVSWVRTPAGAATVLLSLQHFASSIVICIVPSIALAMFDSTALTPEALVEAPRKALHLVTFATFCEHFVRIFVEPTVIDISNQDQHQVKPLMLVSLLSVFLAHAIMLWVLSPTTVILSSILRGVGRSLFQPSLFIVEEDGVAEGGSDVSDDAHHFGAAVITWSTGLGAFFVCISLPMIQYGDLLLFGLLLSAINGVLGCAAMSTMSRKSVNHKMALHSRPNAKLLSLREIWLIFRRVPSLSMTILLFSFALQLHSGAWVLPLMVNNKSYDPRYVAFIVFCGAVCDRLVRKIMGRYRESNESFNSFDACIPVAIALQGCLIIGVSFSSDWLQSLSLLAVSGILGAFAAVGVNLLLVKRSASFPYAIQYSSTLVRVGTAGSSLLFFGLFEIEISLGHRGFAFLIEGLVLMLCAIFAIMALCGSRDHDFYWLAGEDRVNGGAKVPLGVTPNFDHARPVSPSLSTVTEEEETFRHRRRNSALSAFSESSLDFSMGRPFGDTIVEWEMPDVAPLDLEKSGSPIHYMDGNRNGRRFSSGMVASPPSKFDSPGHIHVRRFSSGMAAVAASPQFQLGAHVPEESPPIEELGSGQRSDSRSSHRLRKWNSLETTSPPARHSVGRNSNPVMNWNGSSPGSETRTSFRSLPTPETSPESPTIGKLRKTTSVQSHSPSQGSRYRRWASMEEAASIPAVSHRQEDTNDDQDGRSSLTLKLEQMLGSGRGLNLLNESVPEEDFDEEQPPTGLQSAKKGDLT